MKNVADTVYVEPSLDRRPSVGGPAGTSDQGGWRPNEFGIELSILATLQRHRILLFAMALIGAVVGGVAAQLQPRLYEGVATLMVVASKFSENARPVTTASFGALIQSNDLRLRLIKQFHLDAPPYNLSPDAFGRDALIVEEVRNTNLIKVRVRLIDAKAAADVANDIARWAVAFTDRFGVDEAHAFQVQLKELLDQANRRLESAEAKLLEFRRTAQPDLFKTDAEAALEQRGELLKTVIDLEAERGRLTTALAEIEKQSPVLGAPRAVGAEEALRQAGRIREEAPRVRVKTETDKREASIPVNEPPQDSPVDVTNPFVNPVYQVLQYDIALSRAKIGALEQRRRQLMNVMKVGGGELKVLTDFATRDIALKRLETDVSLARQIYSEISIKYEQARMQVAANSASLYVVDNAIPVDRPLSRYRALYTFVGLVLGLAVGMGAAGFIEIQRVQPMRVR